jgi:hypothetical protein
LRSMTERNALIWRDAAHCAHADPLPLGWSWLPDPRAAPGRGGRWSAMSGRRYLKPPWGQRHIANRLVPLFRPSLVSRLTVPGRRTGARGRSRWPSSNTRASDTSSPTAGRATGCGTSAPRVAEFSDRDAGAIRSRSRRSPCGELRLRRGTCCRRGLCDTLRAKQVPAADARLSRACVAALRSWR